MNRHKLSACIITYKEEDRLPFCLDSLKGVADEVIVVDSYSTDKTVDICRDYGVTLHQQTFKGYGDQKNTANTLASHDMILSLDADEYLSSELKNYLIDEKEKGLQDAYRINRRNWFFGKWMRWGILYPDAKVRVFNRNVAKWTDDAVHETLVISDRSVKPIRVKKDILHYAYNNYRDYQIKMNSYSTLAAEEAFNKGKKSWFLGRIVLYPIFVFIKVYILRLGVLDGKWGFVTAIGESHFRFQKYWKLYLLHQNNGSYPPKNEHLPLP